MTALSERLGSPPDGRSVILSCDDLGLSQAVNAGVYESLQAGAATSAALMVPAPWAREANSRHRGEAVGVQLALNAPFDLYRWGPITHAPSLLDGDGGFPRTSSDLWDHADLDEVRRELRSQVERAIVWGFDVTHLTSHMDTLVHRPEFFDVYLDLAIEFQLPVRLPDQATQRLVGFPFRSLAADEGVLSADLIVTAPASADASALDEALDALPVGVTEMRFVPALDTPEQRAFDPGWELRHTHHRALADTATLTQVLDRHNIGVVGFGQLRAAQRSG